MIKIRLLTSPKEVDQIDKIMLETMRKTRANLTSIDSLNKLLTQKHEAWAKELKGQESVIQEYSHSINLVRLGSEATNNKILNEATKHVMSDKSQCKGMEGMMRSEAITLSRRLITERNPHVTEESNMRKRKAKMHNELQNWIMKYDDKMISLQDELESLQTEHESDLEKLKKTEEVFAVMEVQYQKVMGEKTSKLEELKKAFERQRRHNRAAILIQALWRGYMHRSGIFAKLSKKQKEKKKGGKKKKK